MDDVDGTKPLNGWIAFAGFRLAGPQRGKGEVKTND